MNAYQITGLIGFALAALVVFLLGRRTQLSPRHLFLTCVCAAVGMFVGSHLLFFIVGLPDFIANEVPTIHSADQLLTSIYYASSGLVFYGGLLGALLFMYFYVRAKRLPGRPYFNNIVIAFPVFHVAGRVGCALNGCCYGIEYHGPLAMTYTQSHITPGINDHIIDFTRFPVQYLEALLELIIFIVLLILFLKKGDAFAVTPAYLLMYSVVRFLDEFLRGDENRGIWGPFSTSQWISLAIIIGTIIYLLVKRSQFKKLQTSS